MEPKIKTISFEIFDVSVGDNIVFSCGRGHVDVGEVLSILPHEDTFKNIPNQNVFRLQVNTKTCGKLIISSNSIICTRIMMFRLLEV